MNEAQRPLAQGCDGSTVADAAIALLHSAGVDVCFANPGTTEMQLVRGLERCRGMRSVLGLHEAVCTGACDGYSRIARRPALALLHLGPGLGNGLCNLHNARRARSPILVLVGDHATWHVASDPPLAQDITGLAATVSGLTLRVETPAHAGPVLAAALAAAAGRVLLPPQRAAAHSSDCGGGGDAAAYVRAGCPGSRVVTVIMPHDVSWAPAPLELLPAAAEPVAQARAPMLPAPATAPAAAPAPALAPATPVAPCLANSPAATAFMQECAAALAAAPRGSVALVLGGDALHAEGGALEAAGRVAAALGAALLCEPLPARIDRGAGLPHVRRLPYFPQEAAAELARYSTLVLVDVRRPVAMFGYKGGPSRLVALCDDAVWELDEGWAAAEALQLLAARVPGAGGVVPGVSCRGLFAAAARPALPAGPLTPPSLCACVAALQPHGAVIVDESLTSGGAYWEAARGCPAFTHLCLTGGAIGSGPPMAVGAAVAAHGRRVINLQADGSAMYTLQALWTQARERLHVLTVVCVNDAYNILRVEAARQRTGSQALTALDAPAIDWVALAAGLGVPGGRADTCERLAELLEQGLRADGPFLVHAALL